MSTTQASFLQRDKDIELFKIYGQSKDAKQWGYESLRKIHSKYLKRSLVINCKIGSTLQKVSKTLRLA